MPDTNFDELQRLSFRNFGLDLNGGARVASGLNLDLNGISRQLYGREAGAAFFQLRALLGGGGAQLPGTTGSAFSTPNHVDLNFAGDIDVRFQMENFQHAGNMAFMSRWAAAPNQVWEYRIALFGQHQFFWSTTGSNTIGPTDVGVLNATLVQRITLAVATGTLTHYTSPTWDGAWTQVDQDIIGATSLFAGSVAPLIIGARANVANDNALNARVLRASVRNGINGTLVANPDFRNVQPGSPNYTDSVGRVWTPVGTAAWT